MSTALDLSRLAMATLTAQDFEIHADGALYSPTLLKLFEQAVALKPNKSSRMNCKTIGLMRNRCIECKNGLYSQCLLARKK